MKKSRNKTKKTRNLIETRMEILEVAFGEIFKRGFQGVSVDEIVKKTTLTKGAFYHHFPTKLDLGYALVEDVIQPMILSRWIHPLEDFENPLDGILHLLKKHVGGGDLDEIRYGCPLNNLVQEMSSVDKGFKIRLQAALKLWIGEIERQLQRAKKSNYLKKEIDTHEAAQFIVMSHEGLYGILKGLGEPRLFKALFDSLKLYFKSIST